MSKPEIIGYQTDPDNWWAAPQSPEITFDSQGISVPRPYWDAQGRLYEEPQYLQPDEVDAFMRHHGMKRLYKPRDFFAEPLGEGDYSLHCRKCGKTTQTVKILPHDAALRHRCGR